MNRYQFSLTNESGHKSRFLFPSFRAAYTRAQENGDATIWFTDKSGRLLRCEPLAGEEYPGVPA